MLSSTTISSLGSTAGSSVPGCANLGPGVSCAAGFSKPTVLVQFPVCSSSFDAGSQWNGEEVLQFSGGQCTNGILGQDLFSGNTVTRTFAPGTSRAVPGSTTSVLLDTSTANTSGWDRSVTVGNGTTVTYVTGVTGTTGTTGAAGFSAITRTVTINGLHLTSVDSSKPKSSTSTNVAWDATISSTALAVTGAASSRVVQPNGTLTVQDNKNQVTADITIAQKLTFGDDPSNAHCCVPTGGELTASLSGAKTGSETLIFGPKCGQATVIDSTGHRVPILINDCY